MSELGLVRGWESILSPEMIRDLGEMVSETLLDTKTVADMSKLGLKGFSLCWWESKEVCLKLGMDEVLGEKAVMIADVCR